MSPTKVGTRLCVLIASLACCACGNTNAAPHGPPTEPPSSNERSAAVEPGDAGSQPSDAGARSDAAQQSAVILDAAPPDELFDAASAADPTSTEPPVACAFEPEDPALVVDNPSCPHGVYEGNAEIYGAEDIALLAGCTRIRGFLSVGATTLTSLAGLEALRVVEGGVSISGMPIPCPGRTPCDDPNPQLQSLAGLENLVCIGGGFEVSSGHPFTLTGLGALAEIGGSVSIWFPAGLSDPDRLQALERVFGDVRISSAKLPNLTTIYGSLAAEVSAPSVTYVGCAPGATPCRDGILGCERYPSTQAELDSLAGCVVALEALGIGGDAITNLDALRKLRRVQETLSIYSFPLSSLAGLEGLESAYSVDIDDAPVLTDISALDGIELTDLTIVNAPQLTSLADLHELHFPPLPEAGSGPALLLSNLPALITLGDLDWAKNLDTLELMATGLHDLQGLEALEQTHYSLWLSDNPVLASLRGLAALRTSRSVDIKNNPMLPQCEIDWLLGRVTYDPQWSSQENNGPLGFCAP